MGYFKKNYATHMSLMKLKKPAPKDNRVISGKKFSQIKSRNKTEKVTYRHQQIEKTTNLIKMESSKYSSRSNSV